MAFGRLKSTRGWWEGNYCRKLQQVVEKKKLKAAYCIGFLYVFVCLYFTNEDTL